MASNSHHGLGAEPTSWQGKRNYHTHCQSFSSHEFHELISGHCGQFHDPVLSIFPLLLNLLAAAN